MKDVLPPEDHRSIRSIPVPPNRRKIGETAHAEPPRRMRPPEYEDGSERPPRGRKRSSLVMWIAASAVLAILAAVVASIVFKKATVTVTPQKQTVTLPQTLTAYADAPLTELQFQTVTTANVGNRSVPASGEAHVEKRATGTVTIYNEYSVTSQRLIKNTRFEAPDGKIYRIDQSVVVPGGTKKADGTISAGTLDVMVSADSAGDTYNRGIDTFTIPGFKGDPRYAKFYAKGKTPIAGGFVGTQKVVAEGDLSAAKTAIQAELAESLKAALQTSVPAGYVLVPQSTALTYEELPQGGDASAAVISLRGTAQGAIVREADLASAIARAASVVGYNGEALRFADIKNLSFMAKATAAPGLKTLPLSFSGEVDLIWQIDAEAIRTALVGAPTSNLLSILMQFKPSVADAKAKLRPFWETSFPKDPELIKVVVSEPS